jgi:hypothetical protein
LFIKEYLMPDIEQIRRDIDQLKAAISSPFTLTVPATGTALEASAAIPTGYIPFGIAGNLLGSDGGLVWDNTNKRLGIGTTNPVSPLTILKAASGTAAYEALTITTGTQIGYHGVGAGNYMSWRYGDNYNSPNEVGRITVAEDAATAWCNAMIFHTSTTPNATLTERMRISSTGNVGIGTTNPVTALDVNGTLRTIGYTSPTSGAGVEIDYGAFGAGIGRLLAYDRTNSVRKDFVFDALNVRFASNNGTERMRIDTNGNVGIGMTSPSYALDVTGQCRISNLAGTGNRPVYATSAGLLYC